MKAFVVIVRVTILATQEIAFILNLTITNESILIKISSITGPPAIMIHQDQSPRLSHLNIHQVAETQLVAEAIAIVRQERWPKNTPISRLRSLNKLEIFMTPQRLRSALTKVVGHNTSRDLCPSAHFYP